MSVAKDEEVWSGEDPGVRPDSWQGCHSGLHDGPWATEDHSQVRNPMEPVPLGFGLNLSLWPLCFLTAPFYSSMSIPVPLL